MAVSGEAPAPSIPTGLQGKRAVVAKLGFDAHWRGAIVVARALRDAGMEVIYLGHATAEEIVTVTRQEDPVLIGLSCLSGNHLEECPPVLAGLRAAGCDDVLVVLGGTIPDAHLAQLAGCGIDAVFPTGSPLTEIVRRIAELVNRLDTTGNPVSRSLSSG